VQGKDAYCVTANEMASPSENSMGHKIIINKIHIQFIKLKNNGVRVFVPVVFATF
jgi:hypothetical protein